VITSADGPAAAAGAAAYGGRVAVGDGNGWLECRRGHRHWGLHGAAGLLLVRQSGAGAVGGPVEVLLQLRSDWTHHGGTWALPGGAADSHEPAATAALREAEEETGVAPEQVAVLGEVVGTDHDDWRYTVVFAEPAAPVRPRAANTESEQVRWVAVDEVAALPLHPGFAESWPAVRAALTATLRAGGAGDAAGAAS
jgi:8-oxo-dGTP pyrophosphatase MutT (NUDIX family)